MIRGTPKNEFPKLFKNWNVAAVTCANEIEPFSKRRDLLVKVIANQFNVDIKEFHSHTIYNPYDVLQKNQNKVPIKYQTFMSLIQLMRASEPVPLEIPDSTSSQPAKTAKELENEHVYDVPALSELHVDETQLGPHKFPGGERVALSRLEKSLSDKKWVCQFEKPKTAPNSLQPSTTVLSPYVSFGCLSSRLFHSKLQEILKKNPKHSKPPVSLLGQLMWREFYYVAAAAEENFDRMVGNSICRQIPWHDDANFLDAWAHGRTGYPFIDAIMRQLRTEGWIHHLARHAVACFLTRGDLWQSWEKGQRVFDELLLDADWALNAGNWMWLSASAFYYQYYRVYSPVAFGKKTDPSGNFIRKYCPELKHFPSDVIYEPWKATVAEQKQYKCILGADYSHRIVVHEHVVELNLKRMQRAYKVHNGQIAPSPSDFEPLPKILVKEEMPVPFIKLEKQEPPDEVDPDNIS